MNCRMCSGDFELPSFLKNLMKLPAGRKEGTNKLASTGPARDTESFVPRTEAEIEEIVKKWERYAHPRARDFFPTHEELVVVLRQLAAGVQAKDDPILSEDGPCVYWYGDVTKEEQQAAIRMVKPGEMAESVTFVNRVLAFVFATDESFEMLMRLPKEPFRMVCGNQLCVSLAHISIEVDE